MSPVRTTVLALLSLVLLASPLSAQGSNTCAGAQVISGPGPHAFDTSLATTGTDGQAASACNFFGSTAIENDVWFRWTASSSGTFLVSTCEQTTVDTKMAVYSGIACPPGVPLWCDDDWCAVQALARFNASAGTTYTIQLGNSPFGGSGTGTFRILPVAAATNDNCASQAVIPAAGGVFAYDATLATVGPEGQANPGCAQVGIDVWYIWTAPSAGMASVDTCAQTNADTRLAVYAGGCPGMAGTSIACDDDGCGLQSLLQWPVSAGAAYTFQVGGSGVSGNWGTFTVELTPVPANDNCSTPANATSGTQYDNTTATTGTQGQTNPCGPIQRDLWFTWTASMTGTATIDTCGQTGSNTSLAVYSGSGCPGATALTCNDDGCVGMQTSEVTVPINAGAVYTIQLGSSPGFPGGPGSFVITETPGGVPMTPFCFPGENGVVTCPCTNPPTQSGRGCDNFGAGPFDSCELTATGTASISNDTLVFTSSGENNTSLTIFLQGPTSLSTGLHFGAGVRCVAGSLKRLYSGSALGGSISRPGGTDPSVSVRSGALGDPLSAGSIRYYFPFYRDPGASGPCGNPATTFNCGNAGTVTWAP